MQVHAAINCATDELALTACRVLRRAGLRVPEDVSVVGYSDLALSQLFDHTLTTVVVPFETMGHMAVHHLPEFIGERASSAPALVKCVPVHLAARESSWPVRVHQVTRQDTSHI